MKKLFTTLTLTTLTALNSSVNNIKIKTNKTYAFNGTFEPLIHNSNKPKIFDLQKTKNIQLPNEYIKIRSKNVKAIDKEWEEKRQTLFRQVQNGNIDESVYFDMQQKLLVAYANAKESAKKTSISPLEVLPSNREQSLIDPRGRSLIDPRGRSLINNEEKSNTEEKRTRKTRRRNKNKKSRRKISSRKGRNLEVVSPKTRKKNKKKKDRNTLSSKRRISSTDSKRSSINVYEPKTDVPTTKQTSSYESKLNDPILSEFKESVKKTPISQIEVPSSTEEKSNVYEPKTDALTTKQTSSYESKLNDPIVSEFKESVKKTPISQIEVPSSTEEKSNVYEPKTDALTTKQTSSYESKSNDLIVNEFNKIKTYLNSQNLMAYTKYKIAEEFNFINLIKKKIYTDIGDVASDYDLVLADSNIEKITLNDLDKIKEFARTQEKGRIHYFNNIKGGLEWRKEYMEESFRQSVIAAKKKVAASRNFAAKESRSIFDNSNKYKNIQVVKSIIHYVEAEILLAKFNLDLTKIKELEEERNILNEKLNQMRAEYEKTWSGWFWLKFKQHVLEREIVREIREII